MKKLISNKYVRLGSIIIGSFIILISLVMIRDVLFYNVLGQFGLIKHDQPTAFLGTTLFFLGSILLAILPKLILNIKWPVKFHFSIKKNINWLSIVPLLLAIILPTCDQIIDSIKALSHMEIDAIYADIVIGSQPGFFEELLIRGTIFILLLRFFNGSKWQIFMATIISSLIFGSIHFINLSGGEAPLEVIQQVVYATVFGIGFAILYIRTGSLWLPIIIHSFVDITSLIQNSSGAMTWTEVIIGFLPVLIISLWMIRPSAPGSMLKETDDTISQF